jgi:3',5'-cyclic AMP phosphodiesterase CpdA
MIRLAHLSDIHITTPALPWRREDYFTKRFPGWLNFRFLGRRHRFHYADEVLTILMKEVRQRGPDQVVFSGDATAMGFEPEFARAAELLGVGDPEGPSGLAVPGNHDYYTRGVAASGLFEKYFGPWQQGTRLGDETYPFAQRVGPLWLVGVNSCTGNRWAWDAGGSVGAAQLERLERLLQSLSPGPRMLVTHYPVALASGKPERRTHGLRDLAALLDVAARGGVRLWLHGHRHGTYMLPGPTPAPFPVICAGSATQTGLWSYGDYEIEDSKCRVTCWAYNSSSRSFLRNQSYELRF